MTEPVERFADVIRNLQDLRQERAVSSDQTQLHAQLDALRSKVDRLETAIVELRARVDGLR